MAGTQPDLSWLMTSLVDRVDGVEHALAVTADGLVLAGSPTLGDERAAQAAAITAGLVSLSRATGSLHASGAITQTLIHMTGGFLFLLGVSDGSFLVAWAKPSCDVGQVGYEVARLAEQVGNAITPSPRPKEATS